MSDYQSIMLLLFFIFPVMYMIDTALVIIRRNAKHIENRLAFLTICLLASMIFFNTSSSCYLPSMR